MSLLDHLSQAPFPFRAPTWPESVPRPAPKRRTGLAYDHDWSRRYPVRVARAVLLDNVTRPLARVVAPATVRGLERIERMEGPLIFVANHSSHLDTPLLLTTLPVKFRHKAIVAAASDTFFDTTWKSVLWSFSLPAIPIERTRVNRQSADVAADLVEEGWNLVIFPEGGRTPDGWAQEFRGGAAYLARRTGRPVVPVYLHGTRHVLPKRPETGDHPPGSGTESKGGPGLRRAPVTLIFGTPLSPAEGEDARHFGVRIERAVAVLAKEAATDWWTARRQAAEVGASALRGPDASTWRRAWALPVHPDEERPAAGQRRWPK